MENRHLSFGKLLSISLLMTLLLNSSLAQVNSPQEGIEEGTPADTSDLLFRKSIPREVEKAATEALEYYPELQELSITFEYNQKFNNAFMQAQPQVTSLLKDRKDRVYRVIMTRHMLVDDTQIPVEELPHEVLVGWLGHELGHIMDYTTRSSLEMIWFGFRYITSDKFKSKAEREADLYAIKSGLADNIIATKNFILSNTALPDTYIQKIERLYLSPESVLEIVQELEEEVEEDEDEGEEASLSTKDHFMEISTNSF